MGEGIHLSVVIPVYNEIARVPATLRQVVEYLASECQPFEVIVVDDGSQDDTATWVEEFSRSQSSVRLLRQPVNRGKGRAVQAGMMAAHGDSILFTDADLSSPITEASRLLEPLQNGYDVAIGS